MNPASRHYRFCFRDTHTYKYLWLGFGCTLLLLLIFFMFLPDSGTMDGFLMMVLLFLPLVIGFVRYLKKSKAYDAITLGETALVSAFYGEVPYDAIAHATNDGTERLLNIKLILTSGKQIKWAAFSAYSRKDNAVLKDFLEDLTQTLLAFNADASPTQQEAANGAAEAPERKEGRQPLRMDLKRLKKSGYKGTAMGFSLLALVVAGSTYLIRKARTDQQRSGATLAEMYQQNQRTLKDRMQHLIADHYQQQAPFYLYSNDQTVNMDCLPLLERADSSSLQSVLAIQRQAEAIVDHPDSVTWAVYLHFRDQNALPLEQARNDTALRLYWAVVHFGGPDSFWKAQHGEPAPHPLTYQVGSIRAADPEVVATRVKATFTPFLDSLRNSSRTRVYLLACGGGHPENAAAYHRSVRALKTLFVTAAIDTTAFRTRKFK